MRWGVVLIGAASLGIGFAGGYIVGKTYAERAAEAYIIEELEKDRAVMKNLEKDRDTPVVQRDFEENEERATLEAEFVDYLSAYSREGEIVKNIEIVHKEVDVMDPSSYEEDAAIVTLDEGGEEIQVYRPAPRDDEDDDDQIFVPKYTREEWRVSIISPEEYRKGEPGQVREEFTYYEGDDVIVDSGGTPIEEDGIFGDALGNFGTYGSAPDQVHVRNREVLTDACITRVSGSYSELVLRIPVDEDYRGPRRMRDYDE